MERSQIFGVNADDPVAERIDFSDFSRGELEWLDHAADLAATICVELGFGGKRCGVG